MPRPMSLALSTRSTSRRDEDDSTVSVSLTRTPTMKKAKARLSRLLHRKSFELQEHTEMYECRDASKKKIKSLHRQTMFPISNSSRPIGGGTQDIRWHNLQQTIEHGPHKLSMVSERDEPLTPLSNRLPRPASRSKRVLEGQSALASADLSNRPPLDLYGYRPEYRPESAKSSIITKTIASTSKHDSMLTDYSELCAMPSDFEDDESREIHELPSSTSRTRPSYHGRTPSYSAPILATEEEEPHYLEAEVRTIARSSSSASSHYSKSSSTSHQQQQEDVEETPVSPIAPRPETVTIPQVTARDVQNMPDFSFIPNAVSRNNNKHLSAAGHASFVAKFPDCADSVVTDWQVECYRLRKQLKAVELQLRYRTEVLASEQTRSATLEQDLERTKTDLRLCRGETQLLRVSNGLKHDETCALKAELGSLKGGDSLMKKLRAMAERLALEEDAVADKDLRIKWLEKEREELERENRVLENVKGALWGHMEQARIGKRDTVITTPLSSPGGGDGNQQPSWWI